MPRSGYPSLIQCGTSPTVIIPHGNHRRCIIISNPTQDALYWGFSSQLTAGNGILLPPNQRPERIYREEIGQLIDADIWGVFGNTAGPVVTLVGYES